MSESIISDREFLDAVVFNADGLVAVIAQDAASGAVLMQAWMNAESVSRTLASGRVTYWSRSRQDFWVKGESSGHLRHLVAAQRCHVWLAGPRANVDRRVD